MKKYLSKRIIKISKFDFVFNYVEKNLLTKKDIDFIVYHRLHKNKRNYFKYNFITKLLKLNFKIFIVGDKIKYTNLKNLGYISKIKLIKLLKRTKYSLSSDENIYNFFTLDCINNNVKIITDKTNKTKIKKFKKNFIFINFKKNKLIFR